MASVGVSTFLPLTTGNENDNNYNTKTTYADIVRKPRKNASFSGTNKIDKLNDIVNKNTTRKLLIN